MYSLCFTACSNPSLLPDSLQSRSQPNLRAHSPSQLPSVTLKKDCHVSSLCVPSLCFRAVAPVRGAVEPAVRSGLHLLLLRHTPRIQRYAVIVYMYTTELDALVKDFVSRMGARAVTLANT
jgi:hypothetical protein